jgi:hypothetical protein
VFHAALVLAAGLNVAPPAPPALGQPARGSACAASMDPQFVYYVAPPERADAQNSLLRLIASSRPTTIKASEAFGYAGCPRPIQARRPVT